MDIRNIVTDPLIDRILTTKRISNAKENEAATFFVEKCWEAFDLPRSHPFRQKVSKILDLVEKFNVERPLK